MKQAITVAALIDLFPDPKVRKQVRCAALKLGPEVMALPAQDFANNLEERLHLFNAPEFTKSASAYRSNLRRFVRWGIDERFIEPPSLNNGLGYPTFEQFLGSYTKRSTVPRTVWNHFLRFVSSRQVEFNAIQERHLMEFKDWLSSHVKNYKRQWNLFCQLWNRLAEAGALPMVMIEGYISLKPAPYTIILGDLPEALQQEIKLARDRVNTKALKDRKGKRLLARSTVSLREETILRYLGWLHTQGHELSLHASVADWVQDVYVDGYLKITNLTGHGLTDMGQYQRSILLNMEQHMRHGFLQQDKAALLQAKRQYYAKRFHVRREASKEVVSLNDVYSIIWKLLERANQPEKCEGSLSRALAVRDAVAILLLAMFGYRRTIVTKLHIGTTFKRINENGVTKYLVQIPKKETKPRIRDGYYEVPEYFNWLLDFYHDSVRPFLMGKRTGCGHFLLEQGGSTLSGASLYRIMVDRSLEVLHIRVNPHMLRKSLATEWLEHNPNDLLTLSLIMDCSVRTIEKNYATNKTRAAVGKFDSNIRKQLAMRKAGCSFGLIARDEDSQARQELPHCRGELS